MPLGMGFGRWGGAERVERTIDVIRQRLGDGGALLYRYRDDDGLPGRRGVLHAVLLLARRGARALRPRRRGGRGARRGDRRSATTSGSSPRSSALDGAFLGNLPQALTHASLVSAVVALGDVVEGRTSTRSTWSKGGGSSRPAGRTEREHP